MGIDQVTLVVYPKILFFFFGRNETCRRRETISLLPTVLRCYYAKRIHTQIRLFLKSKNGARCLKGQLHYVGSCAVAEEYNQTPHYQEPPYNISSTSPIICSKLKNVSTTIKTKEIYNIFKTIPGRIQESCSFCRIPHFDRHFFVSCLSSIAIARPLYNVLVSGVLITCPYHIICLVSILSTVDHTKFVFHLISS